MKTANKVNSSHSDKTKLKQGMIHQSSNYNTTANPEKRIEDLRQVLLDQEDESEDQLDFLPSNLQINQPDIRIVNSSGEFEDEHEESSPYYQSRLNQAKFMFKLGPLSEIMQCNNECSSIIFHPEKKGELKQMPGIPQEKQQLFAAQNSDAQERQRTREEKVSVIAETSAGSLVNSPSTLESQIKGVLVINARLIIGIILCILAVSALAFFFGADQKLSKNMGKPSSQRRTEEKAKRSSGQKVKKVRSSK